MTTSIGGTTGITFPDASTQNTAATGFGFKNRIINGAMMIDQRNAGASVTITNTATPTYTLDRFYGYGSVASKFSVQQNAGSVTPPTGFKNYLGATSASAYSVLTADNFVIAQTIEGYNIADLGWGTASASAVAVSFWVRSSLTGTFGGAITNGFRSYPFTYTISSANTWEYKTILIPGDTSGTWNSTNGIGAVVQFGLGAGSTYSGTAGSWAAGNYVTATGATSVVGTSGATFYITGVQLEKGSTATSFDYRPYGTELVLCQRYYQKIGGIGTADGVGSGFSAGGTSYVISTLPVDMRSAPSVSYTGTLSNVTITSVGVSYGVTTLNSLGSATNSFYIYMNHTAITAGQGVLCRTVAAGTAVTFSAEL